MIDFINHILFILICEFHAFICVRIVVLKSYLIDCTCRVLSYTFAIQCTGGFKGFYKCTCILAILLYLYFIQMITEFNLLTALKIILSRFGEDISSTLKQSQIYTENERTGQSLLIVGYVFIAKRQRTSYREILECSHFKAD